MRSLSAPPSFPPPTSVGGGYRWGVSLSRVMDYFELTKPRLVSLVLLSVMVGFFLASPSPVNRSLLFLLLFGTALVAGGAMTLNQWMERREDALMSRTCHRPLPARLLEPREALAFGILLAAAGLLILMTGLPPLTSFLALITLLSYVLLYTPLKRKTSLCTLVGALPGALPILMGWVAASGRPSFEAWILFFILFMWQMPHFLAIAWLCREDYAAARFCMLSVLDPDGRSVGRQIVLYTLALLPVSLLPSVVGLTGILYFLGALVLGGCFVAMAVRAHSGRPLHDEKARLLFRTSIIYLTLLFVLMVIDKI